MTFDSAGIRSRSWFNNISILVNSRDLRISRPRKQPTNQLSTHDKNERIANEPAAIRTSQRTNEQDIDDGHSILRPSDVIPLSPVHLRLRTPVHEPSTTTAATTTTPRPPLVPTARRHTITSHHGTYPTEPSYITKNEPKRKNQEQRNDARTRTGIALGVKRQPQRQHSLNPDRYTPTRRDDAIRSAPVCQHWHHHHRHHASDTPFSRHHRIPHSTIRSQSSTRTQRWRRPEWRSRSQAPRSSKSPHW